METELERVGDWARERIKAGQEPPWTYYKLMQLVDAIEGLSGRFTLPTEDLQRSPDSSESDPQPQAKVVSLDSIRPRPMQTPAESPN